MSKYRQAQALCISVWVHVAAIICGRCDVPGLFAHPHRMKTTGNTYLRVSVGGKAAQAESGAGEWWTLLFVGKMVLPLTCARLPHPPPQRSMGQSREAVSTAQMIG